MDAIRDIEREAEQEEDSVIYDGYELQKKLNQIQLVTPLSLLIVIAVSLATTFMVTPSSLTIFHDIRTVATGSTFAIYGFFIWEFLLLTGFSILLNLSFSEDTMEVMAFGVGVRFTFLQLAIALWLIAWTSGAFFTSLIFLGISLFLAISIYMTLMLYPPSLRRPLEALFVHVPISAYVPFLSYFFLVNALIVFGYYTKVGDTFPDMPDGWLDSNAIVHEYLIAFIILIGEVINAFVFFWRYDIILPICLIIINISQLQITDAKPPAVYISIILGLTLNIVILIIALVWIFKHRHGIDDEDDDERSEIDALLPRDI